MNPNDLLSDPNAFLDATKGALESELRMKLMAMMETGNHGQARTLLREIEDANPDFARELNMDVVESYGMYL